MTHAAYDPETAFQKAVDIIRPLVVETEGASLKDFNASVGYFKGTTEFSPGVVQQAVRGVSNETAELVRRAVTLVTSPSVDNW